MELLNSHEWLEILINRLLKPEAKRVDKMVKDLCDRNAVIKKEQMHCFMHLGKLYVPDEYRQIFRMTRRHNSPLPSLAFELLHEVAEFTADARKLELDRAQMKQVLYIQLINTRNMQDIRNVLPECLISLMPELDGFRRTLVDPTYHIRSNDRAVKEFHRMLPKIEFYAMTHFIY